MTGGNTYSVPVVDWNSWSSTAKDVFNETYEAMVNGYQIKYPPRVGAYKGRNQLKVIAWNLAYAAAETENANVDVGT